MLSVKDFLFSCEIYEQIRLFKGLEQGGGQIMLLSKLKQLKADTAYMICCFARISVFILDLKNT